MSSGSAVSPLERARLMAVIYEKLRHVYKQTDVGDIGPYVKTPGVDDKKKTQ